MKLTDEDFRKAMKRNINQKPLKDKLKGQRLGQALWNALATDMVKSEEVLNDVKVSNLLFYIPDEDLRKLLNDYLREL